MRGQYIFVFSIIFCLLFANLVSVNADSELGEDPLVQGWSKDIRITNASGDSLHPSIAVDSKGWIHIVWQDARTGDWKIYYARSMDSGETWEEKVIADQPGSDNTPSIIVDENDVLHVVWSAFVSGEGTEIYYKNSTDGGNTWGNDIRLTYAYDDSFTPKIVAYENTLHVVWSDKRDGNFEIYYKGSDDGGKSWNDDVRLTNDGGILDHQEWLLI